MLSGQLTFITETFELLTESCAKCDLLFVYIFNVQWHVHFKNRTSVFKLLYMLNHTSCLNKICRICCTNTHIQSERLAKIRAAIAEIHIF